MRGHSLALCLLIGSGLSIAGAVLAEPDVSPTGSIGGFKAKFVDVNGVRTR